MSTCNLKETISFRVRGDHYSAAKKGLHHGQKSLVFRSFTYALADLLADDRMPEIYAWLLGETELRLPKIPKGTILDREPEECDD